MWEDSVRCTGYEQGQAVMWAALDVEDPGDIEMETLQVGQIAVISD